MRAERYRLRFFSGATLTQMTYGSGTYGDGTYGMQKSDALTTVHHRLIPLPAGTPTVPSWRYRQNDTQPDWEAQIVADDGVVDFAGVDHSLLIMTPVNTPNLGTWVVELDIDVWSGGGQYLSHQWKKGELGEPGMFRVGVVIVYDTGRQLSVPTNDTHVLVVTPNGEAPVPLASKWDAGRWDLSQWR